jgi:hypothetical protein
MDTGSSKRREEVEPLDPQYKALVLMMTARRELGILFNYNFVQGTRVQSLDSIPFTWSSVWAMTGRPEMLNFQDALHQTIVIPDDRCATPDA